MKRSLPTLILFGGLSLTALTGCAARGGYYVSVPPPPPRYVVLGYAPGPGFVWTDGFYVSGSRDDGFVHRVLIQFGSGGSGNIRRAATISGKVTGGSACENQGRAPWKG